MPYQIHIQIHIHIHIQRHIQIPRHLEIHIQIHIQRITDDFVSLYAGQSAWLPMRRMRMVAFYRIARTRMVVSMRRLDFAAMCRTERVYAGDITGGFYALLYITHTYKQTYRHAYTNTY